MPRTVECLQAAKVELSRRKALRIDLKPQLLQSCLDSLVQDRARCALLQHLLCSLLGVGSGPLFRLPSLLFLLGHLLRGRQLLARILGQYLDVLLWRQRQA